LELLHEVKTYPKSESGRVIIPQDFKEGKSIVAVCLGEISIINKLGERITLLEFSNGLPEADMRD